MAFSTLPRVPEATWPPSGALERIPRPRDRWRRATGASPATRFFFTTGISLLLACLPSKPYAAGETQRQSWTVAAGATLVLAEYYEIQEADCRAMRAPPVVVKARPALGKLIINTTTALADKPSKCRHVKVPVTRVLYHAGSEPGRDTFGWEVFFQARELGTRSVQGSAAVRPRTGP